MKSYNKEQFKKKRKKQFKSLKWKIHIMKKKRLSKTEILVNKKLIIIISL